MSTTLRIGCALTVLLVGCRAVDGRAADAAGADPDTWTLHDAAGYLPPADAGPRPHVSCAEGVTRRRIDGLPGAAGGLPAYRLAARGAQLAVAYGDEDGTTYFGLIDPESESIAVTPTPGQGYPWGIRPSEDGWDVLWVNLGQFAGIDRWSESGELVDRTPLGAPAGPVDPGIGGIVATDFGFATVLRSNSPDVDPFWLVTYRTTGIAINPIHVPEELYAPATLEGVTFSQSVGEETVVVLMQASSPTEIITLVVSVSNLSGSEWTTDAAVLARQPAPPRHQYLVHSTGSELVIGESLSSDWLGAGPGQLRYLWLDSSLEPLGDWRMNTPAGVSGYSVGAAGAFPRQALLAMGTPSGTFDNGFLYFGLASAVGELPDGMNVVANGVVLDREKLVWQSGPDRYSVAFWRSGIEILTFTCEGP